MTILLLELQGGDSHLKILRDVAGCGWDDETG